jgi:hypothetical protein
MGTMNHEKSLVFHTFKKTMNGMFGKGTALSSLDLNTSGMEGPHIYD